MTISPYYESPELGDKQYFNIQPEYVADKQLYDNLLTEAYNLFGVPIDYYITSWNTSADRIFGEDSCRKFERKFTCMVYYELPKEEELWSKYGIEGLDNFWMYCSKVHFAKASTTSGEGTPPTSGVYDEYIPKAGDIVYAKYTGKFYEILTVKDADEIFLQKKHSWYFIVKPYLDEHIKTTALTSATEISAFTRQQDIFDVTSAVDAVITAVEYNPLSGEQSPQVNDPFSGW